MTTPKYLNEFTKNSKQQSALKTVLQGGNPADERVQVSKKPDLNVGEAPNDVSVGDVWKDGSGNVWEQKDGYKIKHGKRYNKQPAVPLTCPECDVVMSKRLDTKMYNIHQMCFDCVIEFEDKIKKAGKWELYEKKTVAANMRSWIEEQKEQFEEFLETGDREEFIKDEFGNIETWSVDMDVDQLQSDFNEFISMYETHLSELDSEIEELS